MNIEFFKDRGRYLLSLLIFLIALSVIGISLFRWLNSSAEESIQETYRNIDISIHRSLNYTLGSVLNKNQLFNYEYNGDDELLKVQLVDAVEKINSDLDGEFISSVSFVSRDDKVYRYFNKKWFIENNPLKVERENDNTKDPFLTDHIQISLSTTGKDHVYIALYFNIEKYYLEKIKTGDRPLLEEYELIWHFSKPDNTNIFAMRDFEYLPIAFNDAALVVGVSNFIESGKDGYLKNRFRSDSYSAYIEVYKNGEPFLNDIVRHLRMQWLLYFSLLLGLGTVFVLNLNQIKNLNKIREREKEFVASITHELRTPLAVINSAADNIKSGILSKDRTEQYGKLIINQSKRLSDMIEGVLLFSRFEGKVERRPELSLVTGDSLKSNLLQLGEVVEKDFYKCLKMDMNLPVEFMSDKDSLELILSNLILNSAKHAYNSVEGGEIRVKGHLRAPGTLIFTVEDDGTGISSKERKDIFKPFFRGEKSHENQVNGSGLGLFLTAKKVELLGGRIKLESPYTGIDGKLKQGARFIVELEVTDA